MITASQISELRLLLERYYDCLTSPEEEARLAGLLQSPGLPEEFAADAALFEAAAGAPLSEEEIEVPRGLEERILEATCGAPKRNPWRRVAPWIAAACVAAIGVVAVFSAGEEESVPKQLAQSIIADTILISAQEEIEIPEVEPAPNMVEASQVAAPEKPRPIAAAPKAKEYPQGNVREVTDTIEAERLLAEAFALIGSTMELANQSRAEANETLAETIEYLQIANILLK